MILPPILIDKIPDVFRKEDFCVVRISSKDPRFQSCRRFIEYYHYSRKCSNTAVYMDALYLRNGINILGVAQWLPPTRVAAESVNREWTKVISLSRLCVHPLVPKNAASFLLAHSEKLIIKDRRFISLVTYADQFMNHSGKIYLAANWTDLGLQKPQPRWEDAEGRQIAKKATRTRSKSEMLSLGYRMVGCFAKRKFIKHLKLQKQGLLQNLDYYL